MIIYYISHFEILNLIYYFIIDLIYHYFDFLNFLFYFINQIHFINIFIAILIINY